MYLVNLINTLTTSNGQQVQQLALLLQSVKSQTYNLEFDSF